MEVWDQKRQFGLFLVQGKQNALRHSSMIQVHKTPWMVDVKYQLRCSVSNASIVEILAEVSTWILIELTAKLLKELLWYDFPMTQTTLIELSFTRLLLLHIEWDFSLRSNFLWL